MVRFPRAWRSMIRSFVCFIRVETELLSFGGVAWHARVVLAVNLTRAPCQRFRT
jgi:hypothetical protein